MLSDQLKIKEVLTPIHDDRNQNSDKDCQNLSIKHHSFLLHMNCIRFQNSPYLHRLKRRQISVSNSDFMTDKTERQNIKYIKLIKLITLRNIFAPLMKRVQIKLTNKQLVY